MRLALKLINHSFSLNWGYAPVASLDKSLFYQNLFYTLRKTPSLPLANLSLTKDPRNISAKWLTFRTPLTPLASTEKKTISGFDTRLAGLKGPTKIKANRRRGAFLYSEVSNNKTLASKGLNPLVPFISQGGGWGIRSARANSYLKNGRFLGFKKLTMVGFFGISFLPKSILACHRNAFLAEGGSALDTAPIDVALLIGSDVNQGASLLIERAFFEGKVENPNIIPQNQNAQTDHTAIGKDWGDYLFWATGVSVGLDFCMTLNLKIFFKSQTAKRGVLSCL
jgi:hypothetical protein